MLMDILMEALMSMDEESLDSVLESCDAEELEIISDAMERTEFDENGKPIPTKNKNPEDTKDNILANIGNNAYMRGETPDKEAHNALKRDRDNYNESLKNIKSDRRASKLQGKEIARRIRAADLKSKLLTNKPLDSVDKGEVYDKYFREHRHDAIGSPDYRINNYRLHHWYNDKYPDGKIDGITGRLHGEMKLKDMRKAKEQKGRSSQT